MTPHEFAELARTYGGRLSRWPDDRHAEAAALLEASPELLDLLRSARSLDDALAAERREVSDARVAQLVRRIVASTAPQPRRRVPLKDYLSSFATGVLIAAGVAGMLFALQLQTATRQIGHPDVVSAIIDYENTLLGGER